MEDALAAHASHPTRRAALALAAGGVVAAAAPRAARAATVTALDAATALAAALTRIAAPHDRRRLMAVLPDVEATLKTAAASQSAIAAELKPLKLIGGSRFTPAAMASLSDVEARFEALAPTPYRAAPVAYRRLFRDGLDSTFLLGECDFAAFAGFYAGVGVCLILAELMDRPRAEVQAVKQRFLGTVQRWSDPGNAGGLAGVDAANAAFVSTATAKLDAHPLEIDRTAFVRGGGHSVCRYETRLHISGDLYAPITAAAATSLIGCQNDAGQPTPAPKAAFAPLPVVNRQDLPAIPQHQTERTGYPEVDAIIDLRESIIAANERGAAYIALGQHLQAVRAALGA